MLSKEVFTVLNHYLKEGVPKAAIAREVGISRMTVYRQAVSGKTAPGYTPRPPKPRVIDPFQEYIQEGLARYPELTAVRIFAEIREGGYGGKYTAVKDFVRLVRPKIPLELERRFETPPGQQAQVDFATFKTPFGTVHALLVVLPWSRYLWARFYMHQDQLTVLGTAMRFDTPGAEVVEPYHPGGQGMWLRLGQRSWLSTRCRSAVQPGIWARSGTCQSRRAYFLPLHVADRRSRNSLERTDLLEGFRGHTPIFSFRCGLR